jgi:hypothetical protein
MVVAENWLDVDATSLLTRCEPLGQIDPSVRYRICRAFVELYDEPVNHSAIRQLIASVREIAPDDVPSEYFAAILACGDEHNSPLALVHIARFASKARAASRWDIFGWELELFVSSLTEKNVRKDPIKACGG